jgi:hypothetical protein
LYSTFGLHLEFWQSVERKHYRQANRTLIGQVGARTT